MLERLAVQYYEDDDVSEDLRTRINQCWARAKGVLRTKTINAMKQEAWFHDWYLTEFTVYCERKVQFCRITLSKRDHQCRLVFSGVEAVSMFGELISPIAKYPDSSVGTSFAQVLDTWMDYQKRFECCLLLDNERFIVLKAKDVLLCE